MDESGVKVVVRPARLFCRVLLFDKAGVGLSDPVPKVRSIDDRAAEIEAVMDAAGFTNAVVMGLSEGGPAAIWFAATRPARVKALILTGTFAYSGLSWDDTDSDPDQVAERLRSTVGEGYAPIGRASGADPTHAASGALELGVG